ncbi:MAG: hypothetical protein OQJ96_06585 [Flavobacteriales bacterium]|nr:hypothetical protein [Flavobacteriales bacterium]MCW8913745.1 hypothetical protein [Flavobacteriales bacterium]MCW8938473.1 hypothetical protein [Flavobacteriales bacterium]MCW8967766.1 hypothetical protein [Flavobacteriales bacterium]MCW8989951.1 hypothetical protein [Flavobacteriales bacterium]
MKSNTKDLFHANSDILNLLSLVNEIGWKTLREQSIQRIIYFSKVMYSFIYIKEKNLFENYHFSKSVSGPYADLIKRSVINLKSTEIVNEDEEGNIKLIETHQINGEEKHIEWLRVIIYILGLYGENKIFNFTIHDPLYKEALDSNTQQELDASPENKTIQVLNQFKTAFEETLDDVSNISNQEYLELYFEYVFSQIINRGE